MASLPAQPLDGQSDSTLVRPPADQATVLSDPAAPQRPALGSGTRLGPYVVRRLLGSGGMGEVYECEDVESGRRLAVKTLGRAGLSPTSRARFLREGRLAAALSHPNTIYIFGSDEIDGLPIIAMELVTGGTLADRVRTHGPMAVREAVAAIRQIIEGLAAAVDRGILHRDVKPANCFIDADGAVKVGDFGLSVSTERGAETQLTLAHTMLGTPAFASPEQLRGDDLDVRSDIYSVGATLYFLLTGHAPFEESNLMKLVSQVAADPPKPIQRWRRDVPDGLAAVIGRCLAKAPADRFPDYRALLDALAAFETEQQPARPLTRSAAYVFDHFVGSLPQLPLMYSGMAEGYLAGLGAGGGPSGAAMPPSMLALDGALMFLYFTLFEGAWGTTAGKALFGLKVARRSGGVPGVARAAARAAMFLGPAYAAGGIAYALAPPPEPIGSTAQTLGLFLVPLALMTASRWPRLEGWHDRLTGTQVVRRAASIGAAYGVSAATQPSAAADGRAIGPYRVAPQPADLPEGLIAAHDPRLNRSVWIRMVDPGAAPVTTARRDLARSTRLRWVGGRRGPNTEDNWDAYEAVDGTPLARALRRTCSWATVRHWLGDLASEAVAAAADHTGTFQRLDDVWVTRQGQIKVIESGPAAVDAARAIPVLVEISRLAGANAPPPLHVGDVMAAAEAGRMTLDQLAVTLNESRSRPAAVTPGRRARGIAASAFVPLAISCAMVATVPFLEQVAAANRSGDALLRHVRLLDRLTSQFPELKAEREAVEIVIAGRFGELVRLPPDSVPLLSPERRATAERVVNTRPRPAPEEIRAAETLIAPLIADPQRVGLRTPPGITTIATSIVISSWVFAAAIGLIAAFTLRGGIAIRLADASLVRADGTRVTRVRATARALLAWTPALIVAAIFVIESRGPRSGPGVAAWAAMAVVAAAFAAGGIAAVRSPSRGWQDRLAGTWIVPR